MRNQSHTHRETFAIGLCQRIHVQTVVGAIADLQRALPAPVAVETGVNYLRRRAGEIDDGAFVAEVVDRYLEQLPLNRVWEIHLAGGMEENRYWLAAHSGAIPDPLLDLARQLLPALPNLRALAEGRLPDVIGQSGACEIEVTPDGPAHVSGLDAAAARRQFPFH